MLEIEATLYISLDVHTEILFYWRLNKYISGGLENILFGISINTEQILLWTEKRRYYHCVACTTLSQFSINMEARSKSSLGALKL